MAFSTGTTFSSAAAGRVRAPVMRIAVSRYRMMKFLPCGSCSGSVRSMPAETRVDQIQPFSSILSACVIQHRRDGLDECAVLRSRKLDDLAVGTFNNAARVLLLAFVNTALERDGLLDGLPHGDLKIVWPGIEGRTVQEDRPRDIEMAGERVKAMEFVHAVSDSVRQRIFLRVDRPRRDRGDRLGEVEPHRHCAQKLEGLRLHLARQHPDAQPAKVGGCMDGACPIGDMAEAILEKAEDAIADAILDRPYQRFAELAVDRGPRLLGALEQEGQVGEAQLGDSVGEIAR